MSSGRKRVVLTMKEKVDIIAQLEKGETGRVLAKKYGVGKSTISNIRKNSDCISRYVNKLDDEKGSLTRKTMKKPKIELLDDAVYSWFMQKKASGQHISGPLLCEKALSLNKELGGDLSFVASTGWLRNFKSRHGIRLNIHGEKSNTNAPIVELFSENFKKYIEDNKIDMDFVYNADEISLNWKDLPSKSLVSRRLAANPEYKLSKDRITVLVCANATGTHRIPLFLISKSKNPHCLKNVKIPLIYKSQENAWLTADLFIEWFEYTFVPEVEKFQQSVGKEGKVLLLLDHTPSHPSLETLNAISYLFEVIFFPSNVASLVQPMNQNVKETLKRHYKKELICRLLLDSVNDEETFLSLYQKFNLKDCCYMFVEAWKSVQNCTLERSWNKLLKRVQNTQNMEIKFDVAEIYQCISQVHVFRDCDEENINEWLLMDTIDPGYNSISDDEINHCVLEKDDTERKENEIDEDLTSSEYAPSHSEAFDALDLAFKWFERQEESNTTQLLQLRSLRDLAALKKKSTMK